MALYLVTRNTKCSELLQPGGPSIDWPDSVVGLMKGELGLPHRGFPPAIEEAILKGAPKLQQRAGLVLPPVDFEANITKLSITFGFPISPEQAMSSLMYPKVFADYIKRQQARGGSLLGSLPTPVYLYGGSIGHTFTLPAPTTPTTTATTTDTVAADNGKDVTIQLLRVGPLNRGKRTLVWSVDGREYSVDVTDKADVFVFEGPMADAGDAKQVRHTVIIYTITIYTTDDVL